MEVVVVDAMVRETLAKIEKFIAIMLLLLSREENNHSTPMLMNHSSNQDSPLESQVFRVSLAMSSTIHCCIVVGH